MVKVKNQTPVTVDKTAEASSTVVQAIIAEQLYDLQGRPAFSSDVAVKGSGATFLDQVGFETSFISERNPAAVTSGDFWTTSGGSMAGKITSWVDPNVYSDTDNQQHAYSGRYYEADPTSRTDVTSAPGLPFQASTPQALRYAYGQYDQLPGSSPPNSYSPPPSTDDITKKLKFALNDPVNQSKNDYQTMVTRVPLGTAIPMNSSTPPALYQISMTEIAGGAGFNLSIDNDNNFLLSNTQYQVTSKVDSIGNHIVRTIQHNFPNYYDSTGNITTNKINFQMQTEIDALGRTTYNKGPDDQGNQIYYDTGGLLRFSQNADQAQAMTCLYYVYDGMGRLAQINGIPLSTWDIDTLETYLAIPNEVIPGSLLLRQYTYDNPADSSFVGSNNTLGRLVQVDSWNCAMDLSSNTNGNTYYNNSRVTEVYNYDSRGRLAQCQLDYYNTGSQVNADNFSYTYNNLSQVTQIAGSMDSKYTVNYQYNLQGLLSGVSDQNNTYVEYVYNADGTLNSNTMPLTGYQTAHYYNTIKQLRSTLVSKIDNTGSLFGEILYYTDTAPNGGNDTGSYVDGNIASLYSSYNSLVGANNFIYKYTYDSFKRLTQANASPADGDLSVMPSWNVVDTDPVKGYDSNGNIYSTSSNSYRNTYNPGTNQLNNVPKTEYFSTSYAYSPSGRLSQTNISEQELLIDFTYDILLGRPISIIGTQYDGQGSHNPNTTIIYDAAGERIYKSTNNMTIQYYRHGPQVLYEQLSYTVDEPANFIANYYYGLSGIVGGTYKKSGDTSLPTYNSIVDHLGSTRLIIDSDGSDITYFNYDTWGNIVADNSSDGAGQESPALYAGITRYLYTGQEWDADTGLYNYHARQYDPTTYRFLTPDPIYQYTNPYTYAANNPVNFVDPTGMSVVTEMADAAEFEAAALRENLTVNRSSTSTNATTARFSKATIGSDTTSTGKYIAKLVNSSSEYSLNEFRQEMGNFTISDLTDSMYNIDIAEEDGGEKSATRGYKRVNITFFSSTEAYDKFFNSEYGFRGNYHQSVEAGQQYEQYALYKIIEDTNIGQTLKTEFPNSKLTYMSDINNDLYQQAKSSSNKVIVQDKLTKIYWTENPTETKYWAKNTLEKPVVSRGRVIMSNKDYPIKVGGNGYVIRGPWVKDTGEFGPNMKLYRSEDLFLNGTS